MFIECSEAIHRGELVLRTSREDKVFHFQNWFSQRLTSLDIAYDPSSRNTYPDFRLVHAPEGYEIKGLAYHGRESTYDTNSQIPTGLHNGRAIYYVFGRYPANVDENRYPVIDLVMFHGDFLNSDHDYVHKNRHVEGFGSYGDILIRDREMYVAPTPFALTEGTVGQHTLILPDAAEVDPRLGICGELTRVEADRVVVGYTVDLVSNTLTEEHRDNPTAGEEHVFSRDASLQSSANATEF